jgi:hypothetical protein
VGDRENRILKRLVAIRAQDLCFAAGPARDDEQRRWDTVREL